jgi:large subunit ribosomal protein L7/L12
MPTDSERIDALEHEVRRLTELVNVLARRTGLGQLEAAAAGEGGYPDVLAALDGGKLIEAIKLYRAHTNCGLKEAKDAVEALARARGI